LELESCFWQTEHSQHFTGASAHIQDDARSSDELDFENATKADPERNMSDSASVCSLSREHCLPFQFLGPLARFVGMMGTAAPSDAFQSDAIQFEEANASQADGGGAFKLSLHVSVKVSLRAI
jgi:hypothetical protein